MHNIKGFIAALSLSLTCLLSAAWATNPPAVCPSIDALKKASLYATFEDPQNLYYISYQINSYNTPEIWGFLIGVPHDQATDKADGFNKAKAALNTLTGTPVPTPAKKDPTGKVTRWHCMYYNHYQYPAIAFTPLNATSMIGNAAMELPVSQ